MDVREFPAWLGQVRQALEGSPLRGMVRRQGSLPGDKPPEGVSGQYVSTADLLDRVSTEMESLFRRLQRPLHLVVMGEVKAGKSTLVNALVGRMVAPVDVLEATACVMEIRSGERDWAAIADRHEQRREGSPEEVAVILERHRGDEDFFRSVSHVEVELKTPGFEDVFLVDTPGLATLTQANEERVQRYLSNADVVLWVLNGVYLGQGDVAEQLARAAKTGRPMIGVINKLDLATVPKERVVAYVERELGHYLEAIFPLSAVQAWQAVQAGEGGVAALRESGLLALIEYLDTTIRRRVHAAHTESLARSAAALLREERAVHETYRTEVLQRLIQWTEEHKASLEKRRQAISVRLESTIRRDAEAFLWRYGEQARHWMRQRWKDVEACLRDLSQGGEADGRDAGPLAEVLSLEPVREWWLKQVPEYERQMREAWRDELSGLLEELRGDALIVENPVVRLPADRSGTSVKEGAVSVVGESLAAGAVAAASWAGYLAWLGPAAAQLAFLPTLGSVLLPVGLPVLATWLSTKLIGEWLKGKRERERIIAEIYDSFASWVMETYVEGHLIRGVRDVNERALESLFREYVERVCAGLGPDALAALSSGIGLYVAFLDRLEAENRWDKPVEDPASRKGKSPVLAME